MGREATTEGRALTGPKLPRETRSDLPDQRRFAIKTIGVRMASLGFLHRVRVAVLPERKKLKRVSSNVSPTFRGFYLYYPSRRQQPFKMKAFVEYTLAHSRKR